MSTVFLRFASPGAPQPESPSTLAEIHRRMMERPGEFIVLDEPTYLAGEAEMKSRMKARGYGDIQRDHSIPAPNFLLFGIPVVCRAFYASSDED